eukprot:569728-Pyramimonas_sp.AAC.1
MHVDPISAQHPATLRHQLGRQTRGHQGPTNNGNAILRRAPVERPKTADPQHLQHTASVCPGGFFSATPGHLIHASRSDPALSEDLRAVTN